MHGESMEKERLQSGTAQWKKYKYQVSSQKDPGDEPLQGGLPIVLPRCVYQ
jgi:hypothetical protein